MVRTSFLPYLLAAVLSISAVIVVGMLHPQMVNSLIMKVDQFGLTDIGAQEKMRLAQIQALPIPYEKKEVLIRRTVFMGANTTMVFLALGQPKRAETIQEETSQRTMSRWVYHFEADKRPTILEFENEVLVGAHKASALDINIVASSRYITESP